MRLTVGLALALTSWTLSLGSFAQAQTPTAERVRREIGHLPMAPACATQEYLVEFTSGDVALSDAARTKLHADLDAARRCNVRTVFVSGFEPAQSNAVRDFLAGEGVLSSLIHVAELDSPLSDWPYVVDYVRITLIFR